MSSDLSIKTSASYREKLSEVHDELQKKEALLADFQPDLNQNGKWTNTSASDIIYITAIFSSGRG